jgi:hypothetical protein
MFKRFAALAALGVFCLGACITIPKDAPPLATDDAGRAYIARAMQTPLSFSVSKEKGEETWSRINAFVSKYSSMKIQTASEYILETYNPTYIYQFGYSANRNVKGNEIEFTVSCFPATGSVWTRIPAQNAHILALYAMTGELRPEFVVQ